MKKEKYISYLLWLMMYAVLGYMIFTGDFQYQYVFNIFLVGILILMSIMIPVLWYSAATGEGEEELGEYVTKAKDDASPFVIGLIVVKTAIAALLLYMAGYSFLLVWFVVVHIALIALSLWCKKKAIAEEKT